MAIRFRAIIAACVMLLLPMSAAAQSTKAASDWALTPGGAVVASSGASLTGGEIAFTGVGQSVVIDAAGAGAVNLGVQGTFTGTLKVQWSDKPTAGFQDGKITNAAGTEVSTITAVQQYVGGTFARYLKITTSAWTSGTASVTPLLRSQRFSAAGAGGGGGGAATIADGADVAQGAVADAACATDTGTCSELALIKRANQRLTTLNATLGTPLQAGGTVSLSGTLPSFGTTPTFNLGTLNGAATATNQTTTNASLSSMDGKLSAATPAGTNITGDVGTASFSATCTTLTLPGTGGTYASGDLVANSATAGSVTPLTCTVARYSGGPVTITRARIQTSTTGLGSASFRVHGYTATPTVTNGNDGVFLSTTSGHFCRLDVTVDQAFSDGAIGAGVPTVGTSCTRVLSATTDIRVLVEARAAYAWTSAQTLTVVLEGFN